MPQKETTKAAKFAKAKANTAKAAVKRKPKVIDAEVQTATLAN